LTEVKGFRRHLAAGESQRGRALVGGLSSEGGKPKSPFYPSKEPETIGKRLIVLAAKKTIKRW